MKRVTKITAVYIFTILVGTLLSSLMLSLGDFTDDWQFSIKFIGYGLLFSLVWSLPALFITVVAHWKLKHLDDDGYLRMMMRVLLGLLVATYMVMMALKIFTTGHSELQRAYLIYSAIAVAMTFYSLRPKTQS